jgi:hypothetical protein
MPATATGGLANAPIKVVGGLNGYVYLRLDKKPTEAVITDPATIALITAHLATSPTSYDCDTLANQSVYTLAVTDLTDEKVTFTFTAPDGTVYTKTVDFSKFLEAEELDSSDNSVSVVVTDDSPANGPDDKKVDLKVNVVGVTDYVCINLGGGKKAFGTKSYNVAYGDATRTPIAGSELYTVTETGDAAILALGTFATLTQATTTIASGCPCDCYNHTFA